ncbi:flagellar basal body P-ring formation chaperone FlgA [Parvularcula lutaonensis]|uniref:Flagella basal body P-ring formation protein FlgA n=1 Tax=Parvularcula lutaonensis TaxID=491923 RepID=A0ABV7M8X9_9PROT|nr:flagellar basal body P-ring formation chaperone FlgA [Parvularcula lutaonensis]GGY43923.1 hypothetical protein GCM10007148_10950 [Parvularcula lutaonensis]
MLLAGLAFLLVGAAAGEVEASRPIARGEVITAGDLTGAEEALAFFIGKEARRPLFEGARVRPFDVREPIAVSRQQTVIVVFERGTLTLRTEGRSLSNGTIGTTVEVVLPGRRKPVSGVVTAPGRVAVHG